MPLKETLRGLYEQLQQTEAGMNRADLDHRAFREAIREKEHKAAELKAHMDRSH